jgi:hypothetical protein
VLASGILMVAAGAALIPVAGSTIRLVITIGILVAVGAAAAGPSMLLAAVAPRTGREARDGKRHRRPGRIVR